jgi:DNA-binding HxlR family transcriptional regulator
MALSPGIKRFGELLRELDGIAQSILSKHLNELEEHGLINRNEYVVIPLKVEYSLTESGKRYVQINAQIVTWCQNYSHTYDNAFMKKNFGGKWKMKILLILHKKTYRFNKLRNELHDITQSELSRHLKELESKDMIKRNVFTEIPPKVEYSLTEKAERYLQILMQFIEWSNECQTACPLSDQIQR